MATKRKQEWTIRVVQFHNDSIEQMNHLPGVWREQFRSMGTARELAEFDEPPRVVIEFYAPRHITLDGTRQWANTEAERMQSFGIYAVAAPKWERGSEPSLESMPEKTS